MKDSLNRLVNARTMDQPRAVSIRVDGGAVRDCALSGTVPAGMEFIPFVPKHTSVLCVNTRTAVLAGHRCHGSGWAGTASKGQAHCDKYQASDVKMGWVFTPVSIECEDYDHQIMMVMIHQCQLLTAFQTPAGAE